MANNSPRARSVQYLFEQLMLWLSDQSDSFVDNNQAGLGVQNGSISRQGQAGPGRMCHMANNSLKELLSESYTGAHECSQQLAASSQQPVLGKSSGPAGVKCYGCIVTFDQTEESKPPRSQTDNGPESNRPHQ